MKRKTNIIHVELNEPYNGKKNWYFGSVSAIYEQIPSEVIGACKEYLWQALRGKSEFRAKRAVIRKDVVITKEHNEV
jgi:hypothetical protein